MGTIQLKDNIYWVGVKDPNLKVFDIIMETKRGTTYNSYLIDDEKVAIIDTVKTGFFREFLSNVKAIIGNRKVDYIIVQHTEIDHSGSLSELLDEYPDAVVIGTKAAIMYSKQILNKDFKYEEVTKELNLGKTTLKFIPAPNLHWPDTMFTYAVEQETLFTCDVLGCHYCPTQCITDSCLDDYYDEMKYYFDVIMGPFKKFVISGLDKIKEFKLDIVAPSHGPIHLNDIDKYISLYRQWSQIERIEEKNIQIFYVSAYGNTEKIAKYIGEELNRRNIKAEYHEITSMPMEEIINLVEKSNGVMIGSPTINQDVVKPVWDMLSLVCPITNRMKIGAAFGSYGWSGEAVPMLTARLKSLKFKTMDEGLKINFVPSKEELAKIEKFVEEYIALGGF